MYPKLEAIRKQNVILAKQSPYNHCDRWCERCPVDIQKNCTLYLDEMGRQAFNIAHGREPDDLEVLKEDLEKMAEELETAIDVSDHEEFLEDLDPQEEQSMIDELNLLRQKVNQHPLMKAVDQYSVKSGEFLKKVGFPQSKFDGSILCHLNTVAWYHTLLVAKMNRMLMGFYEMDNQRRHSDFAPYDTVAQLDVCKKGTNESLKAFKVLVDLLPNMPAATPFVAMLNNINDQIGIIEQDIEDKLQPSSPTF